MAAADVNTAMAAAVAALTAGDHATALTQALAAQGYMAVLPDGSAPGAGGGGGAHEMTWDSTKIQDFIGNLRRRQSAAAGIQRTKITYTRPTS